MVGKRKKRAHGKTGLFVYIYSNSEVWYVAPPGRPRVEQFFVFFARGPEIWEKHAVSRPQN